MKTTLLKPKKEETSKNVAIPAFGVKTVSRGYLLLFAGIFFISTNCLYSQKWIETWQTEKNFYTIQKAFNKQCKEYKQDDEEDKEKGEIEGEDEGLFPGYIQFKRWEAFMEPRVYPHGDVTITGSTWKNYQDFLKKNNVSAKYIGGNQTTSATWTAMGPFGPLSGVATNGLPRKAGRINFVTLDPSNSNNIWIGAAAGGLWKTTDGGVTWTTNTDNLSVIGCTDMAVDPTNPNIMYLATGDGYGSFRDPSSIGVLKSIDGGTTWSPTGLIFNVSQKIEMRRIIINPLHHDTVLVATSTGIYRTNNGGVGGWTHVTNSQTFDLEFKPTNPDTVYAGGQNFKRSIDGGLTFSVIASGIPNSGSQRMEIGITPANPNLVYVVSANNTNYGLQGVYRSVNAGTTFTLTASTPNLIGDDCLTSGSTGGQGWYDLAIDASPLNPNEVVLGALGVWRSTDGGVNWSVIGCGYTWNPTPPFLHTDIHELEYSTSGTLFAVNDGGVHQYTGTQWNDLSAPMNIAQIFKIGLSSISPDLWITGHQDNGSNIFKNGVYKASLAADGTDNFIDRTNDKNMFASISSGKFYSSPDSGATWNSCTAGIGPPSGFITPWKQDPQVATTLYAGRAQMYRSVNSAASWGATPGTMAGVVSTEFITEFAIAPSNNQYIYAIHGTTGMFVSSNAGTTWTLSNTGITIASGALTFVTVDPTNPLVAYVTQSGFTAGKKVYKTINGGTSWTNISYNLPNLPANCSVFETGNPNGRIYIGMDLGVYYIDNIALSSGSPLWTLYNTGLPNTPVMDMEISAAAPTKLRAATFGRGVYQVDLLYTTGVLLSGNGEIKFNVFPNPTHDAINIQMSVDKATDFETEITDITGKPVLKQICHFTCGITEQRIDISGLANQVYFLKLISKEGNSQVIKIIKE